MLYIIYIYINLSQFTYVMKKLGIVDKLYNNIIELEGLDGL